MRTSLLPLGNTNMAKDYIIDYGNNSNSWYRKWKSGWIEQGGIATLDNTTVGTANCSNPRLYTYSKAFKDTNYTLLSGWSESIFTANVQGRDFGYAIKTATGFVSCIDNNLPKRTWYACGY